MRKTASCGALIVVFSGAAIRAAYAESDSDLAQELTNPIAGLIQAPFQNNFDWGGGPHNNAFRYTLNIQPVIPLSLEPLAEHLERGEFSCAGRGVNPAGSGRGGP